MLELLSAALVELLDVMQCHATGWLPHAATLCAVSSVLLTPELF